MDHRTAVHASGAVFIEEKIDKSTTTLSIMINIKINRANLFPFFSIFLFSSLHPLQSNPPRQNGKAPHFSSYITTVFSRRHFPAHTTLYVTTLSHKHVALPSF